MLGEFGWPTEDVIDLGGIVKARSSEMHRQLFFNLHEALGTFDFNIAVLRA